MTTLAERLKSEREKQNLTQDALAKRVGRDKRQSLISNIEKGSYAGSPYLPEIAYALGLHAMWLKTGLGPKHIHPKADDATARIHAAEMERAPYVARESVRRICELAELVSDEGLAKAAGYLECLAGEYPLRRKKAS